MALTIVSRELGALGPCRARDVARRGERGEGSGPRAGEREEAPELGFEDGPFALVGGGAGTGGGKGEAQGGPGDCQRLGVCALQAGGPDSRAAGPHLAPPQVGVPSVTLDAERQEPGAVRDNGRGLTTGTAVHAGVEIGPRPIAAEAGDGRVLPQQTVAGVLNGPANAPFTEGVASVDHEAGEVIGAPDSGAVAPPQVGAASDCRGTAQWGGAPGRRISRARLKVPQGGAQWTRPAGAGRGGLAGDTAPWALV